MAHVDIRDVRKSFEHIEVLHGVSIDISDGEFVVLVGPSGCGKSTLLRMIAGLDDISGGRIVIDEKIVNNSAPKDRDIAMVFQSYALYPHLTVKDNMAFGLKLRRTPREVIDERLSVAVNTLGLGPLLARFPRQLSGGQRQRVAMGRAMVRQPKVFLFDEPLSNLDAQLRVQVRGEIKALHHRLGATMIYVTHDQLEAMTMADRIVVMRDGHVEQIGPPLELYDTPANMFVAGFIGSPGMNFIKGRVSISKKSSCLIVQDVKLPLPHRYDVQEGAEVVLGVRPEHLIAGQPSQGVSAIAGVVEPTGAITYVASHLAGQPVTAVLNDRRNISAGERIGLSMVKDRVHLFEDETGLRIKSIPRSGKT